MNIVTYTEARNNFSSILDKATEDHDPQIISRRNGKDAVLLSLDDYESLQETDYLLRSPNNAKRLLNSVDTINSGKTSPYSRSKLLKND
jgi:antitoxin YefM